MDNNLSLTLVGASSTMLGLFMAILGLILSKYVARALRTDEVKHRFMVQSIALLILIIYNSVVTVITIYSYYTPCYRGLSLSLFYALIAIVPITALGLTIYTIKKG